MYQQIKNLMNSMGITHLPTIQDTQKFLDECRRRGELKIVSWMTDNKDMARLLFATANNNTIDQLNDAFYIQFYEQLNREQYLKNKLNAQEQLKQEQLKQEQLKQEQLKRKPTLKLNPKYLPIRKTK